MLSRDKVEGLHNYHEFSQPLECLYQDMQTPEKSFLLLLENNFPEKKGQNSLVQSTEVLYTKLIRVLQKKCFPKHGFFSLKNASSSEENWQSMFLKIFLASAYEEMGKWSKLVEVCNSKSFSNSCLRD